MFHSKILNMSRLLKSTFLILMIMISAGAIAQDSKADRKAAKKAKKEEQRRVSMENAQKLKAHVLSKRFVLEAHTLFNRNGNSYPISSNTNFVGFDGENSSIQLSFDQIIGWNGVGGVTIDGKIQKMEIKGKEDQPNFTVNASVLNKGGGLVTMVFRVSSDGNARVDMNGNFGEKLSFQGRLVPLNETTVYKGTPQF